MPCMYDFNCMAYFSIFMQVFGARIHAASIFKIYTSFEFVYLHNKFKTIYVLGECACTSFNYSERHE